MNVKSTTLKINKPQEPYRFTKRRGSTTFQVNVCFNPNAKETAGDKIARLIRSEATLGTTLGKVVNQ